MRTAEEVLKENTGHAYGLMDAMVIKSMKEFALEVAKESLRNAAENAELKESIPHSAIYDTIDKESILSHDNIPEL